MALSRSAVHRSANPVAVVCRPELSSVFLATQTERASAITARPVQYRRFERLLVSADDRAERHHDGYYLVLSFGDLASHFRLLLPVIRTP